MTTITVSRTIAAPIGAVWEAFTDVPGSVDRISGITAVQVLSDVPFGPGFRWRETRRMFGQDATEEMEVSSSVDQRSYEVEANSHGARYHSRYTFAQQDAGTRVEMTFTATPISTLAKVMHVVTAPLASRSVAKALQQDFAELAAWCEQS